MPAARLTHWRRRLTRRTGLILTDSLVGLEELALRSAELDETRSIIIVGRQGEIVAQVTRQHGGKTKVVFDIRLPPGVTVPALDGADPEPRPALRGDLIEAWHPVVAGGAHRLGAHRGRHPRVAVGLLAPPHAIAGAGAALCQPHRRRKRAR